MVTLTVPSLLFAATSGISLYGVTYYRRNGTLPGTTLDSSDPSSIEAQTKDAFSSTPHDAEYDDDGTHTERAHGQDDEYALLHANDGGEGRHGVRPMSWTRDDAPGVGPRSDYDTSYHTGGVYDTHHAPGDPFNNDLAPRHDHGSYAGGRLDFPDAPYNR